MADNISFEIFNEAATAPILVLCDHASNVVPACVNGGSLGIDPSDMQRHIAFDIGAKELAQKLAVKLNAPMLATKFSRLVIDPNRGEDDPTILMKVYDGTIISGNRHADADERERRIAAFHRPYHAAISDQIDRMIASGNTPVLISIHSFTPQLRSRPKRPWHVGILWDHDARIPKPLIDMLAKNPDICVGDNEPYSGDLRGDTMCFHATKRGLPHVLIELRHDLIDREAGQEHWANILAKPLIDIINSLPKEPQNG
ncbi:MAG: N-formylglutamate amidohydrolase [Rhodobacteraceae bacterium]|nr:N-formylglutamate amidohydrolase [Paracoccaceae bacterium]